MPEEFDVGRDLARVGDAQQAYVFIRSFAEHWLRPVRPGDGYTDAEITAAEACLGVRLPAAVCGAYRLFGRRPELTSGPRSPR